MSEGATRDGVVVLRLWMEGHDDLVRARVLSEHDATGHVLAGVEHIVDAVRDEVEAFADGDHDPDPGPSRDADATPPQRDG
ncbi:MAG: hypothetical protein JJE52_01740 [Acidimicrobiia bacterium]|nr:hypothetical protein [Acidimicrobiia bacterium]